MQTGEVVLHDRFAVIRSGVGESPGAYFVASDTLAGDEVLLRRLQLLESPGAAAVVRMRHDVRRVAASPHPHIVRVLDLDVADDMLLIASDLRGVSLRQVLEQRRLALSEALLFAQHAAAALTFAHAHGVTHGMLTPATVDILGGCSARVSDFGLAQIAYAFAESCPGDLTERPGYMPPEASQIAFPTASHDIYQLGALLWEMCLGFAPAPREPLNHLPEGEEIPEDIAAIITMCLQPDPQERALSITAVMQALRAARHMLEGKPTANVLTRLRYQRMPTLLLDETLPKLYAEAISSAEQMLPGDERLTPLGAPQLTAETEDAMVGEPPPPPNHVLQRGRPKLSAAKKIVLFACVVLALMVGIVAAHGRWGQPTHAAPPRHSGMVTSGEMGPTILQREMTTHLSLRGTLIHAPQHVG
jgi:serine/threonine protein kinase